MKGKMIIWEVLRKNKNRKCKIIGQKLNRRRRICEVEQERKINVR
jgi:hypothetical protein